MEVAFSMKPKTVVLVVEDEALVRMDIVSQLEDEGFIVREANNADAAIVILETDPSVSILFTDIDMPGSMDGLKLSAAVRDRWPPVKIVVTSGHRLVQITDMPDGSVFHAKPYRHADVIASFRELTALD
tara:strand:+ start:3330 stop:3716 length:387 start_codon:yes stop_codon:yes gene_type:complete